MVKWEYMYLTFDKWSDFNVSSTLYYRYLVTVIVKFIRYHLPLINVLQNYPFHTCDGRYKYVHQQTTIGITHL